MSGRVNQDVEDDASDGACLGSFFACFTKQATTVQLLPCTDTKGLHSHSQKHINTQRLRPSKHNKQPVAHTWRPVYVHLERVSQGVCGLNQFIFIWCKKYSEFLSFTTSSDNGIYHICWHDLDDVLLLVNRSTITMECTSWLEAKRFTIHTLCQK